MITKSSTSKLGPFHSNRLALLLAAALGTCLVGCEDEATPIEPDPGDPATPATGSGPAVDAGKDAPNAEANCPDLPGPTMVKVRAPNGTAYCIDSTEVTQAQYFEFIRAKGGDPSGKVVPDMSGQPPQCKDNLYYGPPPYPENDTCFNFSPAYDVAEKHPDYPVACVDWCDAHAYCAWAGKRLCGAIGGGATAISEVANAAVDQWYNACSQGGKTKYAFGDTYTDGACPQPNQPVTVEGCSAEDRPYSSIQRLSGGLGEWVDACEPGQEPYKCRVRGGCYTGTPDMPAQTTCDCEFLTGITRQDGAIGFRCCLD